MTNNFTLLLCDKDINMMNKIVKKLKQLYGNLTSVFLNKFYENKNLT